MNRAVQAAWCRLPVCLFAVGKELGKSHLFWSTGKHRWELSLRSISIGNPSSSSSSSLQGVRDKLMTLLPLHPSPRMRLNAAGSVTVIKTQRENRLVPILCNAGARRGPGWDMGPWPGASPSQERAWSSSSSVALPPKESEWVFVWCLHRSDSAELMLKPCCKPPPALLGGCAVAGAHAKLRLNGIFYFRHCQVLGWWAGTSFPSYKLVGARCCPGLHPDRHPGGCPSWGCEDNTQTIQLGLGVGSGTTGSSDALSPLGWR